MTANVTRRMRRRTSEPGPELSVAATSSMAIGEINQTVFDCPACGRPLALGVRRCPGCGTHLVLGIPMAKASLFAVAGLAAGLVLGGAVGFGLGVGRGTTAGSAPTVARSLPSAAAGAASAVPGTGRSSPTSASSASPSTSGSTDDSSNPMSPITRSALVQAVGVNNRLSSSAAELKAILDARVFDASAAAPVLRTMSADAVFGQQLAVRLTDWPGSASLGRNLTNLYGGVHATATEGLVASVRDATAYRTTAAAMLRILAGLPALDAEAKAVADRMGLDVTPSPAP
jgi:hypothetical protein